MLGYVAETMDDKDSGGGGGGSGGGDEIIPTGWG